MLRVRQQLHRAANERGFRNLFGMIAKIGVDRIGNNSTPTMMTSFVIDRLRPDSSHFWLTRPYRRDTGTVTSLRYLLAFLLLLTAIACSAPGPGDQPPAAASLSAAAERAAAPPGSAPQETPRQEAPIQETPEQIIARLAAEIPTARLSIVYTAETDPNQLLGTPHAYVSKAAFVDNRIDPAQANDTETGSIELGGSVEVFTDETDASARKQYLDETLAQLPIDVSEYSYLHGPVLLRLSRRFTPEQAAEYEAALDAS
jgi:hypothetical protein